MTAAPLPREGAPVTLLLLSHAGGGGEIFRSWAVALPSWVRPRLVVLPGRGRRLGEAPIAEWPVLVDRLVREVSAELAVAGSGPIALFGHSLGALVALELAHRLRDAMGRKPLWLCAAACSAPVLREQLHDWLHCPEAMLLDQLRSLGGTPLELLENRELLDMVLPSLRADFHLADSFTAPARTPLDARLLVLGGTDDQSVNSKHGALDSWACETAGPFTVRHVDGGHFFPRTAQDAVLRIVLDDLAETLRAEIPAHG